MAAQSGEGKAEAMAASSAYCYSDASSSGGNPNIQTTDIVKQLQSFQSNPEIYNLTASMEMIGFPSKNLNHHQQITLNNSFLWNHHQNRLLVEDPSLKGSTVFPCDGTERRPSQGLSLSLSSSNPSTIELQSFELRQNDDLRFGPSSSRSVDNIPPMMQGQFYVRNSKYLKPAQELLNEFCNLGTKQSDEISKMKAQKSGSERQWDENAIKLQSLDALELQKTKAKLLQMLDEVDRRYKHYCDQMKGVVSSFEAVAGKGAATVYSAMASKAMSRHFRCLRDAIVNQIKAIQKATGEKDTPIPGATKGETPRLRVLDQKLRQQRAYQQMNMMENHPWRPQRGLPEQSVAFLRAWLFEHFLHPYPSDVDKHILARQTGLSRSQVSNWFINARVRLWKPMVEEMYLEDQKEEEDTTNLGEKGQIPSTHEDRKPTQDQLTNRMDPECLASIINDPGKNNRSVQNDDQHHSFGRVGSTEYGAMQFDFSSYNHHSAPGGSTISYLHENANFNGGGGGGGGSGVSLTLGLQQHGANGGVSLAFSPASQSSLFYPRSDQIEDCQTVQYSLFDSENQNLQYRNLMGAQLLHDLAG